MRLMLTGMICNVLMIGEGQETLRAQVCRPLRLIYANSLLRPQYHLLLL